MKREIKKKPTMKARGIRFSDETWAMITKDAAKWNGYRTTPSDVVREIVDAHYYGKKRKG